MKKNWCIIRQHQAGLFSNINKVLVCMDYYENIHVDWSPSLIYEDCWKDLFEPTTPPPYACDVLHDYPDLNLTCVNVASAYVGNQDWRSRLNAHWLRLRVKDHISKMADDFVKSKFKERTVSALIRSDFHGVEQVNGRSQSMEEYALRFKSLDNGNTVFFLMSAHQDALEWLGQRFPCVWRDGPPRSPKRTDPEPHLQRKQTAKDAIECLVDVMVSARATAFVHGVSNMSTAVLYINPNIVSHFLV